MASTDPAKLRIAGGDKQRFTLRAKHAGTTKIFAYEAGGAERASLEIVVGSFEKHDSFPADLISDICRGSDSLKIHALQRMLHNRWLHGDVYTNGDNVFEQNSSSNLHNDPDIGNMTCGLVAKFRADQVFGKMATVAHDWYLKPIHEPLSRRPSKRSDLKYRPGRVQLLATQISSALKDGKAVRAGVVDSPTVMTPVNGRLVAYYGGGHTVLIVGMSRDGKQFLYIDPWGGGSMMEYKGGIAGNKFSGKCAQLGKLVLAHDPDRKVKASDMGDNIIKQSTETEGSFSYARGNFLEVISAPFSLGN